MHEVRNPRDGAAARASSHCATSTKRYLTHGYGTTTPPGRRPGDRQRRGGTERGPASGPAPAGHRTQQGAGGRGGDALRAGRHLCGAGPRRLLRCPHRRHHRCRRRAVRRRRSAPQRGRRSRGDPVAAQPGGAVHPRGLRGPQPPAPDPRGRPQRAARGACGRCHRPRDRGCAGAQHRRHRQHRRARTPRGGGPDHLAGGRRAPGHRGLRAGHRDPRGADGDGAHGDHGHRRRQPRLSLQLQPRRRHR